MTATPIYSVIIPAYNEEQWLQKSLPKLQECMRTICYLGEIIVVDNNSTDNTAVIAKQYTSHIIFEPINQISRARNSGAKAAKGKYLIFLDADTLISFNLLGLTLDNLMHQNVCGGGAIVTLDNINNFMAKKSLHFWVYLQKKFDLAAGCFIYCTKQAFDEIGGFNQKIYASEDIWFSLKLKKWGKKRNLAFEIIKPYPIVSSGRKMEQPTHLILMLLLVLLFPFSIFFRSFCWFWYKNKKHN